MAAIATGAAISSKHKSEKLSSSSSDHAVGKA